MTSEPIYISCHCQEHIVQLHLPEGGSLDADVIDQATTDDCSHCVKRRLLWYRVPDNVRVEVIKGFGKDGVELKDYQFARGRLNHQFCGKCGTHVSAKHTGVNGRNPNIPAGTVEMYNLRALRVPEYKVKDHTHMLMDTDRDEPLYTYPKLADIPGAEAYLEKRQQVYPIETKMHAGSCHCQAVKYAVLCKPLRKQYLLDCTCSICRGNGLLWMYPGRRNVFFPSATDKEAPWMPDRSLLTMYEWGDHELQFFFCNTCGCMVLWSVDWGSDKDPNPDIAPGRELEDREQETNRVGEKALRWQHSFGVNAALLTDIREYMGEIHNVWPEGNERDAPKGLKGLRVNKMGWEDPIYHVKL